jgi:hypothetical protein
LRNRTHFRRYPRCRFSFSCFARADFFSAVLKASGPVFIFCAHGLIFGGTEGVSSHFHVLLARTRFRRYRGRRVPFSCLALPYSFSAVPRASGPVFMFCAPGLIFGGTEGVGFSFSNFALPDSFSAVLRASDPVFIFFAPGHVLAVRRASGSVFMFCAWTHFLRYRGRRFAFSCFARGLVSSIIEGVGSHFHVLLAWTRFRWYQGHRARFICFARPDSFFDGTEGVELRFHPPRSRTRFRRYRGCRVPFSFFCAPGHIFLQYRGRQIPFSYFALPDSFSAAPRASGPIFMFCALKLIFGGIVGVMSRFHVLRSRTHFLRYRGRPILFLCFPLPDMFLAVWRASGSIFMFCASELVFIGTDGFVSRFHVLPSQSRFPRYRGRRDPFSCFALPDAFSAVPRASGPVSMFCAPGHVYCDTKGVWSRFHVLISRTRFRRYGGCRSRFDVLRSRTRFSAVPRASSPVFMFCDPAHIFDGTKGVGYRFHVWIARTHFRRYQGCPVPFLMFCAPGLVFSGAECVRSRFQVLRARNHFRWYRGRPILFPCFPLPNMFLAVRRASFYVFMFCVPGLIFGGTEGAESRFHVLRSRSRFPRYRGRRVPFSCFAIPDTFSDSRERRVPFSCFAPPVTFSAIPRAYGQVFMF